MFILTGVIGLALIVVVLWDVFETIVLRVASPGDFA